MNIDQMLKHARKHCFFIGLNDSGAELCQANTVYGIAVVLLLSTGVTAALGQLLMTQGYNYVSVTNRLSAGHAYACT
ncbi:MAG TPA: hypothetical protein VMW23_10165 [Sedimentisphaerales bacterium]|nr:hypothetical protein [Sedimentisphaerales bacterium]